jgi:hypothetical protein
MLPMQVTKASSPMTSRTQQHETKSTEEMWTTTTMTEEDKHVRFSFSEDQLQKEFSPEEEQEKKVGGGTGNGRESGWKEGERKRRTSNLLLLQQGPNAEGVHSRFQRKSRTRRLVGHIVRGRAHLCEHSINSGHGFGLKKIL